MQLLVFDSGGNLVRDLGQQYAYVAVGTFSASPSPFSPEEGGLTVTAGAQSWAWAGDKAGGHPSPNGQYLLVLKQSGQADLSLHLWILHKDADFGGAFFAPNPATDSQVSLALSTRPGMECELFLYSLAGELALWQRIPQGASLALIALKSPSGRELAAGLYLARIRIKAPDGSSQVLERKLAVTR
jgi:hypothetical protein